MNERYLCFVNDDAWIYSKEAGTHGPISYRDQLFLPLAENTTEIPLRISWFGGYMTDAEFVAMRVKKAQEIAEDSNRQITGLLNGLMEAFKP